MILLIHQREELFNFVKFFSIILLLNLLIAQNNLFKFNQGNKKNISSSSFWLSSSPSIDPISNNRFITQLGFSSMIMVGEKDIWIYPNVDLGLKLTKNLSITCKSYGFSSGMKDAPHILGAGIQYYYGSSDILNWSTIIQRIDLNGLEYFNLKSLTLDFRKWLNWKTSKLRIGIGTNIYKGKSPNYNFEQTNTIEGQLNYMGLDILTPVASFILGIETRVNTEKMILSLYLQKELY